MLLLLFLPRLHLRHARRVVVAAIIAAPNTLSKSGYSWNTRIPNIKAKQISTILITDAGPAGANCNLYHYTYINFNIKKNILYMVFLYICYIIAIDYLPFAHKAMTGKLQNPDQKQNTIFK